MAGRRLAHVTLVIDDYDRAIEFFTGALGFELVSDTPLGGGKRWVMVSAGSGSTLLLAEASDDAERSRIGNQTGGRVGFFLETDDFERDHAAFTAKGITFLESPRREAYGTVAVFTDRWGNLWDLIEPKR